MEKQREMRKGLLAVVLFGITAVSATAIYIDSKNYEIWIQQETAANPSLAPSIDFHPYYASRTGSLLIAGSVSAYCLLGFALLMKRARQN